MQRFFSKAYIVFFVFSLLIVPIVAGAYLLTQNTLPKNVYAAGNWPTKSNLLLLQRNHASYLSAGSLKL